VVTGAGGGIGAAVAQRFAASGAHLCLIDRDMAGVELAVASLRRAGLSAEGHVCDVTDGAALDDVMRAASRSGGGVDAVVCCAGVAGRQTIAQMRPDDWRRVIDVNLTGAFLALKAAAAHAAPSGASITVISSIAAEHIAYQSGAHYASSKAALTGLVRHAAFELGRRNIRVNAVGPGPMTNRMGGATPNPARHAAVARELPLQRLVEPDDVAEVCWFLASPGARAVTGVYLPVDSGFLTSRGVAYRPYFDAHGEAF
jgi:3-oxoacyl-[acyl-carrier protein] reductase